MISFFIKHKNPILILTVLFFLGSLGFVGAGVFLEEYGPNAPIAKVNGKNIKLKSFTTAYNLAERQKRQEGIDLTDEEITKMKQEILQNLIAEEALSQAAEMANIGVSDAEVGFIIKNSPSFNDGRGFNKQAYVWTVRQTLGMNPSDYEYNLKKQLLAAKYKNALLLASLMTPQERKMLTQGIEILPEEQQKTFSNYLIELKAQSLANSYSDALNSKQSVTLLKTNL